MFFFSFAMSVYQFTFPHCYFQVHIVNLMVVIDALVVVFKTVLGRIGFMQYLHGQLVQDIWP